MVCNRQSGYHNRSPCLLSSLATESRSSKPQLLSGSGLQSTSRTLPPQSLSSFASRDQQADHQNHSPCPSFECNCDKLSSSRKKSRPGNHCFLSSSTSKLCAFFHSSHRQQTASVMRGYYKVSNGARFHYFLLSPHQHPDQELLLFSPFPPSFPPPT